MNRYGKLLLVCLANFSLSFLKAEEVNVAHKFPTEFKHAVGGYFKHVELTCLQKDHQTISISMLATKLYLLLHFQCKERL